MIAQGMSGIRFLCDQKGNDRFHSVGHAFLRVILSNNNQPESGLGSERRFGFRILCLCPKFGDFADNETGRRKLDVGSDRFVGGWAVVQILRDGV